MQNPENDRKTQKIATWNIHPRFKPARPVQAGVPPNHLPFQASRLKTNKLVIFLLTQNLCRNLQPILCTVSNKKHRIRNMKL